MSLMSKAKLVFEQWQELYDKVKESLPDVGTVLTVEKDGVLPHLAYKADQDLLYGLGTISKQIVNNEGNLVPPRWVLLGQGEMIKWPLKIIITGPTKSLYVAFKDEECAVSGIKITGHSRTKKSVLGELVL